MADNSNLVLAFNEAVLWFEHFELNLRNGLLTATSITQSIEMCQSHIQNLLCLENMTLPDNYGLILSQLQNTLQTMKTSFTTEKDVKAEVTTMQVYQHKDRFYQAIQEIKKKPNSKGLKDIAGYLEIKKDLKLIVVLPKRQPQLYVGRKVCKTMLLYGPPGTGKTQMAHALAAEADADIYMVTASTIMSSFHGETEKMIEAMFKVMQDVCRTSFLFIDEIDGLFRKRNETEQDHNRRIKTEFLSQLSNFDQNSHAFLICATNCPWDLDTAFLRRFQNRVYVPLPNKEDRVELLRLYTRDTLLANCMFPEELLERTAGYSGSDLQELVRNALLAPVKELENVHIWKLVEDKFYEPWSTGDSHVLNVFSENMKLGTLYELPEGSVKVRDVVVGDLIAATGYVKSTIPKNEIAKFMEYISNNNS